MALPNIFSQEVSDQIIRRINALTPETQPLWGKMSVAQMLAHCSVTYEMIYEPNKHPAPGAFAKLMLKLFVKGIVVNEAPYKKSSRTAPAFLMTEPKIFETEKTRLIDYLKKTVQMGENFFDGKESHSFGKLNKAEWNNMFYKHLNHHLSQFGV